MIEAMFRKEARVLATIRSPAVTKFKLFGRDPALDLLYFVTDFVPGESLLDRLKREPARPGELRALMRRVLTGLQAAHNAGAVHRDLSPDNIILPGGDVAEAKIIDFGIAKELDPSYTTIIGDSFAGKLGYIAPEQLGFSGSEVGPWTDLYSLALVGVAFAAGKPLDMGATVGRAEEARRSAIDLTAVPDDLRPLFERLLTYDWRERPASAGEVLQQLEEGQVDGAKSGRGRLHSIKSAYQGRSRVALTVGLVAALLGGTTAWYLHSRASVDRRVGTRSNCIAVDLAYVHFVKGSVDLDATDAQTLRDYTQYWLKCPSPAADLAMTVDSKLNGGGKAARAADDVDRERLRTVNRLLVFSGFSPDRLQSEPIASGDQETSVRVRFHSALSE